MVNVEHNVNMCSLCWPTLCSHVSTHSMKQHTEECKAPCLSTHNMKQHTEECKAPCLSTHNMKQHTEECKAPCLSTHNMAPCLSTHNMKQHTEECKAPCLPKKPLPILPDSNMHQNGVGAHFFFFFFILLASNTKMYVLGNQACSSVQSTCMARTVDMTHKLAAPVLSNCHDRLVGPVLSYCHAMCKRHLWPLSF